MDINPVSNNTNYSASTVTQSDNAKDPVSKDTVPGEDRESLIDQAYRSILLNRMGVDTEQLEEIEQKIEELESKSSLTKEEKDELNSLMEARDQLFEDAMRRQAEEGNNGKQHVSPGDIQKIITEDFNPREISPNDMSKLANQLFEAGAISAQQRERMDFHRVKTNQQNGSISKSDQIAPDEPMDFVKHWQDRVAANEHFNASPQEKALAQGVLDVLRQV